MTNDFGTEINVISINEPVPAETFSLQALKIPPGTIVSKVNGDARDTYEWDGENVVKK